VRLRDIQHIIILAQVFRVLRELGAAKGILVKLLRLDHGAHGAIQNDDPLPKEILQRRNSRLFTIQRQSLFLKPDSESGNLVECWQHLKYSVANVSLVVYSLESFLCSPILAPRS
jgi:hypothetical protein